MLTAVLSGFGLAFGAPWITKIGRHLTGWLLALLPLGLLIYFGSLIGPIASGQPIVVATRGRRRWASTCRSTSMD